MRLAAFALGILLCGPASAQIPDLSQLADPSHWSMGSGGEVHDASGTRCPGMVTGFGPLKFEGANAPNLLGSCDYVSDSGNGDAGLRVRRYAPGAGETKDSADNDRSLMEPADGKDPPMMAVQMLAVTTRDGTKGGKVIITKVRNGYLVDCFAEGSTLEAASGKIAQICSN